ncbi:sugar ABC transporter ATP-binding protein [Clostridium sp. KNHs216]|uniref:sugar ABC transporter ATP-binding protein n=1 Tax=Clostridium sp. KNHs216 TaxID=1550235 RepID=UPI0011520EC5|nr:sugar ABC transporter ATP-binding protein [Clostridium sp. KNHs216]TQI68003.1 ribose transport system ATP-binding protein/inositol transport system ATP-binding protein [Clostridium sp. KNHs216]
MEEYRLEIKHLHKRFTGVYAIKDVSFQVKPGEVHAIVGENGAGKSTLMKMINGELTPNEGEILHNGQPSTPHSVAEAKKLGIAMIHQELSSLSNMTIAENLFLGHEECFGKSSFVKKKQMNEKARQILKEYDMSLDPNTLVESLSVAQTQMIEIIKAVRANADIVIMDEPTSSLSSKEAEKLFQIIRDLSSKNVSIIYISHRLEEILDIADSITVLRDGQYIETVDASTVSQERLVELMVGRTLDNIYPKEDAPIADVALEVRNLSRKGVFDNVSFQVHKGEILGISGLMGAGRSEIARAIFGIDKLDGGSVLIGGKEIRIKSPIDAIKNKLAMVSEDRKLYGLVLCRSIKENISLPNLWNLFKGLFIRSGKEVQEVEELKKVLGIKCFSINVNTETLSGGNQQKVVLAKWLLSKPEILILDEPTRGIDVGSKFEIYKLMSRLAKEGMAIVMISSELPEIIGMSDRVLVVSHGKISGEFLRNDITSGNVTQKELLQSALKI